MILEVNFNKLLFPSRNYNFAECRSSLIIIITTIDTVVEEE